MEQDTRDFTEVKSEDLVLWYQNREMLNDESRLQVEQELDHRGIALESIPPKQALAPARPISMAWFNFWRWVMLPMIVLNMSIDLFSGGAETTSDDRLTSVGIILAATVLMILLEKRHIYGWWLNWAFIFAITLSGLFPNFVNENDQPIEVDFATSATMRVLFFALFLVAWFWPNWVYFNKRRYLFTNQDIAPPPHG